MNLKEFLKPTISKIILLIIFLIATSTPANVLVYGADIGLNHGFPFNFYGCCGGPPLRVGQTVPSYFHVQNFIIDIIIWYILSCVIVSICYKFKK
jgi:hypothetical protein